MQQTPDTAVGKPEEAAIQVQYTLLFSENILLTLFCLCKKKTQNLSWKGYQLENVEYHQTFQKLKAYIDQGLFQKHSPGGVL